MRRLLPVIATLFGILCQGTAEEEPDAWVTQTMLTLDGRIILHETPLNTTTGTFTSLPMEGLFIRFDMFVYPLVEDKQNAGPQFVDSEVAASIPLFRMEFEGRDPNPEPRTRVDWPHRIRVHVVDTPLQFQNPLAIGLPNLVTWLILRKRFLDEEHIGQPDMESHWSESHEYPGMSLNLNQELLFNDDAAPPDGVTDDPDSWSGLIEYQLALDTILGSPIPLLTFNRLRIRVWPKWDAEFLNLPDAPVPRFDADMIARVHDIYPGTERVIVEYLHDPEKDGDLTGVEPVTICEETWTAGVAQDRDYLLAALSNLDENGDYYLRTRCLVLGEDEVSDSSRITLTTKARTIRAGLYTVE